MNIDITAETQSKSWS